MAAKKKSKKKATTSKKSASKKPKLAHKRTTPKKPAKKKTAPSKAVAKKKALKQTAGRKVASAGVIDTLKKRPSVSARAFSRDTSSRGTFSDETTEPLSGSGDLQGLSSVESSDSESVDELVDEGNAFEAGVVQGVEDAGERGNREVRTREVPEDDVPEEYLDED